MSAEQFTEERAGFSKNGATTMRQLYGKKDFVSLQEPFRKPTKNGSYIQNPTTIQLLEDNLGENLCDLWLGKDFLGKIS